MGAPQIIQVRLGLGRLSIEAYGSGDPPFQEIR